MKTRILLLSGLLLFSGGLFSQQASNNEGNQTEAVIQVYCTPELHQLTSVWVEEFQKSEPAVRIELKVLDERSQALAAGNELFFSSSDPEFSGLSNMNWKITVGRDVIVPVFNANNPDGEELISKGITSSGMLRMFRDPSHQKWSELTGNNGEQPVHLYISNDDKVMEGVRNFIGIEAIPSGNIRILDKNEFVTTIQQDPNALGFCLLADITDPEKQLPAENIRLLPIDRNMNGKVDYLESFYDDLNMFSRAVWIGKYPRPLYTDIHIISRDQPTGAAETAFLRWIMTSGQPYLALNGYSDLAYTERQSRLDKINNITLNLPPVEEANSIPKLVLLISLAVLFSGLIIGTALRYGRSRSMPLPESPKSGPGIFDESSISVPKGLYFDRSHTWAFMEKDGNVRIGIDDFLQRVTGRITRVDMKQPGDKIKRGEKLVSIAHKGKQLNIYSPVSGIIKDYNRSITNNASLINSAPYSDGWIYMVEPANWAGEIRILSMADNYVKWLYEEFARLKDFLAINLNSDRLNYSRIVLQDGGMLKEDILQDLSPKIWEDFQTDFLDPSR